MDLTINKIAAGVVGLAMVAGLAFAFTATQAQAAELSLSDLVELFIGLGIIDETKADEARAAVEGSTTATPAATMTCNFTRNLTTGDTGADVKDLQKLLNAKGYTVAMTGAGSAGMETEYFGPATAAAVAKMQTAYAAEILTPLGLTTGTGFFGASTRAKANTLCAATTPDVPSVPGDDDDDDTNTSDLSGEASLKTTEMNSADDDEIDEGAEEADIAEITVEFSDGDAMITRLDVALVGTSAEEDDPWDVFNTLYLMVDGDVVAEKDIDSRSDYLDDDEGTIRFSGLDIVGMEDEEFVITVVADVAGSVDGAGTDQDWTISLNGLRFVDGTDVTSTETITGESATFTIEEQGGEDELIIKTSSADLDSSIIKVEDDSKSDWTTVFVFDLDTDDSDNDITLNAIQTTVTTANGTGGAGTYDYEDIVDDARLVIDGVTIDSTLDDVADENSTTADILFDVDGDVVIDAGDRVKAELQLKFKALAATNEGATVQGFVDETNMDAEGADDLSAVANQLDGSATGEEHQLMTSGIFAEIVSVSETKTAGDNNANDSGDYTIKFDVTAFEETYYVSSAVASAVAYHLEDADGADITADLGTSTVSAVISSSVGKVTGQDAYEVPEGDTITLTLKVTFNPANNTPTIGSGNYRLVLDSVDFGDAAATPTNETAHDVSPEEDFQTDYLYLNA